MSSRTGTGTVVARTRSKRCFGAVLSSRGNKYLNCPWGLKEGEVLAESVRNGLEVDGDIEERGLFATGAGTFGGVADLDCMASIAARRLPQPLTQPKGLDDWSFELAAQCHQIGLTSLCPSYRPGKRPKCWQCTPENQDQQEQDLTLRLNPDQQEP